MTTKPKDWLLGLECSDCVDIEAATNDGRIPINRQAARRAGIIGCMACHDTGRHFWTLVEKCTGCDGGTFKEFDIESRYGEPIEIQCGDCKGTGWIPDITVEKLLDLVGQLAKSHSFDPIGRLVSRFYGLIYMPSPYDVMKWWASLTETERQDALLQALKVTTMLQISAPR